MKTTSSSSYGRGAVPADIGFKEFGDQLAKQAQVVFLQKKISVAAAQVINGNDRIPLQPLSMDGKEMAVPTLVLAPNSGVINATSKATRASYVFSAQLFDPKTRRLLWTATIDTEAWVSQDILMKHIEKTVYDEIYAAKLLTAILDRMTQDGIIA